jgi:hemin uptake protein HemP
VPAQATPSGRQVRIETGALFAGRREAIIVHRGEEYRLRITRQDKLILTK